MCNHLIQWCKRNRLILIALFALLVSEAILACVIWVSGYWFWAGGRETFGPLSSYILTWLSIAIASIAALGTVFAFSATRESYEVAKESLELTRAMQRPFLAWKASPLITIMPNMVKLELKIENTGSMPASDVHAYIQFFDKDEVITEDNLSSKYPPPIEQSVLEGYKFFFLLPNHTFIKDVVLDLGQKSHLDLWENIKNEKVKVRLCIVYKGVDRKHTTIQTGLLQKQIETELLTMPILPQKWD